MDTQKDSCIRSCYYTVSTSELGTSMTTIGERLRRQRLQNRITLEQISLDTKIGVRLLMAIEAEAVRETSGWSFSKELCAPVRPCSRRRLSGNRQRARAAQPLRRSPCDSHARDDPGPRAALQFGLIVPHRSERIEPLDRRLAAGGGRSDHAVRLGLLLVAKAPRQTASASKIEAAPGAGLSRQCPCSQPPRRKRPRPRLRLPPIPRRPFASV